MDKNLNQNSLVSICITFKNAEKYLHRVFESCFLQTYKKIEIVVVDDASTDSSEKIVREYIRRDPRIRYFRNEEWAGITKSLVRLFELSRGNFVVLLNTDDWIPRHFIEIGVRDFLEYPDAAAIVPKIISLVEVGPDKFVFDWEISYRSGAHSVEWFVKEIYKGKLCISVLALMRKEDALNAIRDFMQRWRESFAPEQCKKMELEMAHSGAETFLLDIFTRAKYKNFVFDNSFEYVKTSNPGQNRFEFRFNVADDTFRYYHCSILNFKSIYKFQWPAFYSGMKIYFGAQALARSIISLLRYGPRAFFSNMSETKKQVASFFDDFSFFEIILSAFYAIGGAISIIFKAVKRRIVKSGSKKSSSRIFTREHLLDKNGKFTIA